MAQTDSLTDLARSRRYSLASIPVNLAILVVVSLALWGLSRIIHLPRGLVIIVVGVTVFSLAGNVVNVLYINAQIRRRVGRSGRRKRKEP